MTATNTQKVAAAIRELPDSVLAAIVRGGVDDRSLVTLFAAAMPHVARVEHGPAHPVTYKKRARSGNPITPKSGVTARVELLIMERPGIGTRELRRVLGDDTKTGIRKALLRLKSAGLIRREGCTSDSRYYPALRAVAP